WVIISVVVFCFEPSIKLLIILLLINIVLLYFVNNSLTVYLFEDKGIIKTHRIFKKKKKYIPYSDIKCVEFITSRVTGIYQFISIRSAKKSPVLPNISRHAWRNDIAKLVS